ncbi:hypothetical protein NBRC116593_26800 [Sulfitobacter pacificus]
MVRPKYVVDSRDLLIAQLTTRPILQPVIFAFDGFADIAWSHFETTRLRNLRCNSFKTPLGSQLFSGGVLRARAFADLHQFR